MSIRKRLSHEESRQAALEAARALLIDEGPQAVTLKAVAARIGRTHANLLHHFGSAAGLQKALAEHQAVSICAKIEAAIVARRAGTGTEREVVDLVFDAFGKEGGGALASWMLLSGNEDALDPIFTAIRDLVEHLLVRRGLIPAPQLGSYVAARLDRSYAAIHAAVDAIDAGALAAGRQPGIRIARAALIDAGLYDPDSDDPDSPEPT